VKAAGTKEAANLDAKKRRSHRVFQKIEPKLRDEKAKASKDWKGTLGGRPSITGRGYSGEGE